MGVKHDAISLLIVDGSNRDIDALSEQVELYCVED